MSDDMCFECDTRKALDGLHGIYEAHLENCGCAVCLLYCLLWDHDLNVTYRWSQHEPCAACTATCVEIDPKCTICR